MVGKRVLISWIVSVCTSGTGDQERCRGEGNDHDTLVCPVLPATAPGEVRHTGVSSEADINQFCGIEQQSLKGFFFFWKCNFLFLANSPKDKKANAGFLIYTVALGTKG